MNEPNGETVDVNGLLNNILAPGTPAAEIPAGGDQTPAPAAAPQGDVTPPEKTFTQAEVNAMVAAERRAQEDRVGKLKNAGLTEEQIKILEDKEAVANTRAELATLNQEKVSNLLETHKDIVSKLEPTQVEQLRTGSPQKVAKFLESLSAIVAKATPATPAAPAGELPAMNAITPNAGDTSPETVAYVKSVEKGMETGDWGGVVGHLFGQYSK